MSLPKTNTHHTHLQWLGLALLAAVMCAIAAYTFRTSRLEVDEGLFLSSATRVAQGQVMYRDFFEFWMPGTVYVTALFIKLGGQFYAVARLEFILINFLTILILYLSLRRAGFPYVPAVISAAVFFFNSYSTLAVNHHWFGLLGLSACVWLSLWYAGRPNHWIAVGWGIISGLTILCTQFEGAIALCYALPSLWLSTAPKRLSQYIKPLICLAAGLSLPILLYISLMARLGLLRQFIYDAIVFPLTQYSHVNSYGFNSVLICQTIAVIGLSWLLYRQHRLTTELKAISLLALLILAACLSSGSGIIPTIDGLYTFSLVIFYLHQIAKNYRQSHQHPSFIKQLRRAHHAMLQPTRIFIRQAVPAAACFLIFISIVYMSSYAAFIFGYNWYRILTVPSQAIITPAGPIRTFPELASRLNLVNNFIRQHTAANQPIYFGPYSSYYNFLMHRPNPTRYSQITPGYNPDWMLQDATVQIQQNHAEYLIIVPDESPFAFPASNLFYTYITKHYHQIEKLPSLQVKAGTEALKSSDPPPAIWQRDSQPLQ